MSAWGSVGDDVVEFCRRMHPRLVGSLTLLTGDAQTGEDLSQETLARVWDRWDEVRRMAAPEAWAHRVALNLARSRFRRWSARQRRERRYVAEFPPSGGKLDLEEAVEVRQAVLRLPLRQRTAVVLRFFDDLSVSVTASWGARRAR
jgi:RNA polymerase sigma factor (sigma-70 family)